MPKAISVPPSLNTADIPKDGAEVTIQEVRIVKDQWTTIGTCKQGLAMTIEHKGTLYSQMFSLDKEVITGSIGRLLVSIGIDDTDDKQFKQKVQAFVGKSIHVAKRDGKVYWYP